MNIALMVSLLRCDTYITISEITWNIKEEAEKEREREIEGERKREREWKEVEWENVQRKTNRTREIHKVDKYWHSYN